MQTWVELVENFFNIISPVLCSVKKQKKKQKKNKTTTTTTANKKLTRIKLEHYIETK